jgi:hypothetical protein
MVGAWLVVVVAAACGARAWSHKAVLPLAVRQSDVRAAEHVLTVSVWGGNPPEEWTLEVDFTRAGVALFRDQSAHSASYTPSPPTEIVYFGGSRRRVPLALVAHPADSLCAHCMGVLGLRADSPVYDWFPGVALTPASLTLGAMPAMMQDCARTWHAPCENADGDDSLCAMAVRWRGRVYRARLDLGAPYMTLPQDMYNEYLGGKNLFDSHAPWAPLELEILNAHDCGGRARALTLRFDEDHLSGRHGVEAPELLVRADAARNDTLTIGSAILSQFAVYRNTAEAEVYVHAHTVVEVLPWVNIVLIGLLFIILVRFKLTTINTHFARAPSDALAAVDAAYRAAAWLIAFVAFVLPVTRDVLSDAPFLYWSALAASVLSVLCVMVLWSMARVMPQGTSDPRVALRVVSVRLWHEVLILTALWILVAPRSRESVASFPIVLTAVYTMYSIVLYGFFAAVIFWTVALDRRVEHRRRTLGFFVFLLVSVAALAAWYGFLLYFYFARPLLTIVSDIYTELTGPALATFALFIFVMVPLMGWLYIRKSVQVLALQRIDYEGRLKPSSRT